MDYRVVSGDLRRAAGLVDTARKDNGHEPTLEMRRLRLELAREHAVRAREAIDAELLELDA